MSKIYVIKLLELQEDEEWDSGCEVLGAYLNEADAKEDVEKMKKIFEIEEKYFEYCGCSSKSKYNKSDYIEIVCLNIGELNYEIENCYNNKDFQEYLKDYDKIHTLSDRINSTEYDKIKQIMTKKI